MDFTMADNSDGHFNVEGCADNHEWIRKIRNQEVTFYFHLIYLFVRVFRACLDHASSCAELNSFSSAALYPETAVQYQQMNYSALAVDSFCCQVSSSSLTF
uniref:Uncharacterized protein n=1 Tax=Elaeophora elaphi TaxID=1147741 RepID=A0A0R3RVY4_9BILA